MFNIYLYLFLFIYNPLIIFNLIKLKKINLIIFLNNNKWEALEEKEQKWLKVKGKNIQDI
jgi:hypothetical protein